MHWIFVISWRCCRYDRFSFDITDALTAGNSITHEVIVRVFSPLDSAHVPLGKQRLHVPSKSIFYSASSGIWQTVWLEQVRACPCVVPCRMSCLLQLQL